MSNRKVLIVDDDEVLGRVLSRVLAQQGHTVYHAANLADAKELADRHEPDVALVDLCLPDGSGTDLGRELRARHPGMVRILMTAYPLRMSEHPELEHEFARVFTKPLDLKEVRSAVADLRADETAAAAPVSEESAVHADPAAGAEAPAFERGAVGRTFRHPWRGRVLAGVAALVVLALLAVTVWGMPWANVPPLSEMLHPKSEANKQEASGDNQARLATGNPDAIVVPADVVRTLGIRTARVERSMATRPLALSGYLGNDVNHTVPINTLFTGRIESIGTPNWKINRPEVNDEGETVERELRFKDKVKEGDLLAVLYSKDLGEKKSELVDWWSQYRLDQQNLKDYEDLAAKGITSEANVRQARRNVETDLNNVSRVVHTLAVWEVSSKEIEGLKREAERLLELRQSGSAKESADQTLKQAQTWARVEVRAPFDGVLVERNIAKGQIVDSTKDLFKITSLDRLTVYAHAYEENLPSLLTLAPELRRWTVRLKADPNYILPEGRIEQLGSVDSNQHTVPLMGSVKNKGDRLIAGQFITATIQLPPDPNELALPTSAVLDGGRDSYILVQPNPAENLYEVRRVTVVRRTAEFVYVRWIWPETLTFLSTYPQPGDPVALVLSAFFQGSQDSRFVNPLRDVVKPEEMLVVTEGNLVLLAQLEELRSKQKD